ncbi:haloalkane dehalogenase [mine drainage metagenome]|uniref:Haloalkane dehalogenase n=1 Tax=mine drainage metagenome TaxID=410659 RepID=A0A1J5QQC6_9ZZZZ
MYEVVTAGSLAVAYEQTGPLDGWPIVLLHGFPYDVRAFDGVVQPLVNEGARVIVPYLRGFGPTRFLDSSTPRSGEQAALGADLLTLLDALDISKAALVGYDWGGRAACVVAALWPERVRFLVSGAGYAIQNIAASGEPALPDAELRYWYQYYFHGERGRAGLTRYRREFCKLLWKMWSPTWDFDDATFDRTAQSFDNPDFVEIVIHSYRHRFGLAPGDDSLAHLEARLAEQPPITVPTITMDGEVDGVVLPTDGSRIAHHFTSRIQHLLIPNAGHNLPQESPEAFADAILRLHFSVA